MMLGMTKAKIAITIDESTLAQVKARVAAGEAASVSSLIEQAVIGYVSDANDWDMWADHLLESTGGPLTPVELAWVDAARRGEAGEPPTPRLRS